MSCQLDTNVISEWTKPVPNDGVREWLASTEPDHVYLSVITLAELRCGVEQLAPGRRRTILDTWMTADLLLRFEDRILDIDFIVANEWGKLMAHSQGQGKTAGIMDTWIAATATVYGMTVVTRDLAPFQAVAVPCFSPWSGA